MIAPQSETTTTETGKPVSSYLKVKLQQQKQVNQ